MNKQFYVYILASKRNGTLYTGVSSDLVRRIYEHGAEIYDGFSKKYGCKALVYFECVDSAEEAIRRENRLRHEKENGS